MSGIKEKDSIVKDLSWVEILKEEESFWLFLKKKRKEVDSRIAF